MSYTAPTTRTTGTLITASIWNTDMVDNIAYLYSLTEGAPTGWVKELDTWVYVSATSFKITGKDVTARFPKGTKIYLTQTTGKYFYVTSSSFSTDTTVNVTGGSDYSLANATITSPYYSYDHPQGFPEYFNFTGVTLNQGGSTNIAKTATISRFQVIGTNVNFQVRLDATAAGSAGSVIDVLIPLTAAEASDNCVGSGGYVDVGTAMYHGVAYLLDTTHFFICSGSVTSTGTGIGSDPNIAVASGDVIRALISYKMA